MADQRAEEDLRRLQCEIEGVDAAATLEFLGESYDLRMDGGLVAVLRFASLAVQKKDDEDAGFAQLVATHRFLSECIQPDDWPFFQESAITGKASEDDVAQAARRMIEILTARPSHAGLRLLGWAAGNLGELDGQLLRGTGTLLSSLSPRQLCNYIFSARLDGMEELERKDFIEDLNAEVTAEQKALNQALEHISKLREQEAAEAAAAGPAEPEPQKTADTAAAYLRKLTVDAGEDFSVSMDDE